MGELEMELALLREENARLKVERHRPPDAGLVIERMRDLGHERAAERQDEEAVRPAGAGQAIVECLAMRDGLLEACQEVQQAMQEIQGRLGALALDPQGRVGDRARAKRVTVPDAEDVDVDLAVGAQAASNFARNVA